jgi:hypothetical protein
MGIIKVSVGGEPLLEWEGRGEEIDNIARQLATIAAPHDAIAFAKATTAHVAKAGYFITQRHDVEMAAIIYFIAMQPTTHPDHPGAFRDYLSMWDFEFDLEHIEGDRFNVEVVASFNREGVT